MVDLRVLLLGGRGVHGGIARHPDCGVLRISERCDSGCAGCTASWCAGWPDREVVAHELAWLCARGTRVLFAGANPLSHPEWHEIVCDAADLGLEVELLLPVLPLTTEVAGRLRDSRVSRVRLSLVGTAGSPPEFAERCVRAAAVVHSAQIPLDLHFDVGAIASSAVGQALRCASTLAAERLIVASMGCRLPVVRLGQARAMAALQAALHALESAPSTVSLCVEGPAFHERLILEAVEDYLGSQRSSSVEELLLRAS
jgi:hypothetical protein